MWSRLFAGEIAAGIERIDADIVERAAAGKLLAEAPFAGRDVEAECAFNGLHLAERAVANELDGAEIRRLIVAAIGDHQLDVCGLAGGNHLFAVGNAGGHRLFAEHMLAGLGGADGVFGMHGIRQRNIDRIDGGIVRDLVEVLVVVDGSGRHVVLGRDAFGFVAMSADQGGDLRVGGAPRSRHEVACDAAESDYGIADLLLAWLAREARRDQMCCDA